MLNNFQNTFVLEPPAQGYLAQTPYHSFMGQGDSIFTSEDPEIYLKSKSIEKFDSDLSCVRDSNQYAVSRERDFSPDLLYGHLNEYYDNLNVEQKRQASIKDTPYETHMFRSDSILSNQNNFGNPLIVTQAAGTNDDNFPIFNN